MNATLTATAIATQTPLQGKPATQKRIMYVTARYSFKCGTMAGSVCYAVRSIKTVKGVEVTNNYQVMIRTDGVATCNCESRKPCCHMLFVSEIENERDSHEAEQEQEVAEVLAEIDAPKQETTDITWDDEFDAPYTPANEELSPETLALIAADTTPLNLDEPLALEMPPVWMQPATAALKPVPTPTVRKVSPSWLLKGNRGGTLPGRVA